MIPRAIGSERDGTATATIVSTCLQILKVKNKSRYHTIGAGPGSVNEGSGRVRSRRGGVPMRTLRFRVRTLMAAVGVVALLIWGAMMGSRSYDSRRRTREYGAHKRGWRRSAQGRWDARFASECGESYAQSAGKYRRAMWRPWMPVAPDPHAAGFDRRKGQESRAKEVAPDPPPPGVPASRSQ